MLLIKLFKYKNLTVNDSVNLHQSRMMYTPNIKYVCIERIDDESRKIWGTTELLEANCSLEFHRIEMKKVSAQSIYTNINECFCRVWYHESICRQKDYDLIDETILKPETIQK